MGFRLNSDGVLEFSFEEGKPLIPPELLEQAKEMAMAAAKTGGVITAGAVVGSVAATTSSPTLAVSTVATLTTAAVASEAWKEHKETVAQIRPESAHGGVAYEQFLGNSTTAALAKESQANQTFTDAEVKDPFEAFRLCMANAGLQNASTAHEINPSCLPPSQARHQMQSRSFGA